VRPTIFVLIAGLKASMKALLAPEILERASQRPADGPL
jgi:hypothetical protein